MRQTHTDHSLEVFEETPSCTKTHCSKLPGVTQRAAAKYIRPVTMASFWFVDEKCICHAPKNSHIMIDVQKDA